MALADVWMLTLHQHWGADGEVMMNNFFYTSADTGANAEGLYDAFISATYLLEKINGVQAQHVKNGLIRVINLGSFTDFFENEPTGEGTFGAGEVLPMHDAVNFTLRLSTRAIRPGSKRFSGLNESIQANGLIDNAPAIVALGELEFALAQNLDDGLHTYLPIVVKRIGLPTPGTPPYTSYRLPITDGELVFGNVVAALVNLHISHQVSRGNGR